MNAAAATDLAARMKALAAEARAAARVLATASSAQKNAALARAAELLLERRAELEAANARDLEAGRAGGLDAPKLDRLRLDEPVLKRLAEGLRQVVALPDPVGVEIGRSTRPNGLLLRQVRCPIGTILIVFESRPNVTVEAGSLCLKSGNACILRGGREALHSNAALAAILRAGLKDAGLPEAAVSVPDTPDRAAVAALLQLDTLIDLAIPRGGEGLIRAVAEAARVPTIKHYKGICHVYVDRAADLELALKLALNSKLQRVSVCNAAETLLVHAEVAERFLPPAAKELLARGCALHAEPKARAILQAAGVGPLAEAGEATFYTEWLDKALSVKVVASLDEAIEHIERFGSRHTETIVTADEAAARAFQLRVDSASIFWNASTRLADGFEYGLGAEIGISTDKLHARGPMGLEALTTYKWLGDGSGQVRG
ncbi:MAG: glutamate-5-semialdehyde dehydrogenase [Planctomycetota bacterium]|nr:glutamate-5-semialdehyde dehydrogenase [Planctomycetota bacterium]